MASFETSITVNAPVSQVWASWDDFGNIYRYNPNLNGSHLINDSADTGLGAERRCDLADGKNHILERVIAYQPEKLMKIDIYDGTVPIKRAFGTLTFKPVGADCTRVDFAFEFTPKMGLLGKLMAPLMKRQLRGGLESLLAANKAYVETGETVQRAA
ncbi:hypothetical protein ACMU_08715 [Actibacterium mucosum KCTC 23349]|uniref:Polyketide cyclase n=1 Tax=Actibacterium mucosum KCTC 23349 TaxID=1454373 RepID=A0A037ZHC8_9RHOB|nr:SRPBCC family protein [Actibacterium mucosum]KAJ55845.1 hypothetical protein ACMU_08715 [Actibacterium mucosum KCTC 23349]